MYKTILLILLVSLSSSLRAEISVFACEPEWAALSTAVGGDKVEVFSATSAQQDPHHIQARPSLIAKARRADVLVCTGAELEIGWLPVLLRKSANPRIQPGQPGYFMAASHVDLLDKMANVDRSMGDVHAAGNPHVHFDPHRMLIIAESLKNTFKQIDSEQAGFFEQNFQAFKDNWSNAINKWESQTTDLNNKRIIVHHNSWVYLEKWLGLNRVAVLEPKPGVPPTTGHLANILSQLQQQSASAILRSGYEDERPSQWLSEKSGVPIITIPFSVDDYEKADSLILWMNEVVNRLVALK
jgi:zinc/manganese transport system substrate-binding protein